jgi:hypothetical protein
MRPHTTILMFLLLFPVSVLTGQVLVNPNFANGLAGWTSAQLGGSSAPGSVTATPSGAQFLEGDSFLVELHQEFLVPPLASELRFELLLTPGFDLTSVFIPDAFEAHLLGANQQSLVGTTSPFTTSFFNIQEDTTVSLGAGVQIDGLSVRLSLSGIPAGTPARLLFSLIGGDFDHSSGVTIRGIEVRQNCVQTAQWSNYGSGWPGTLGIPTLGLGSAPRVGESVSVLVESSSLVPTIGCLGISPFQASVPTPAGGTILIDPYHPSALMIEFLAMPGANVVELALPYELTGCGTAVYLQVGLFDLGASNGYSFTDGLCALLGS